MHAGPESVAAVLEAMTLFKRPTVRAVAEAAGRSLSVTHGALLILRERRLISWTPGTRGSLRLASRTAWVRLVDSTDQLKGS